MKEEIKKKKKYKRRKRKIKKLFNLLLEFTNKITILIILSLILLYESKYKNISTIKVGLCVICKQENLYIKEFIEHYKNLGYNHIFLYDNNDINGEKLEDVIQKEIDEGFISLINYRGERGKSQMNMLIECYEKNNKNYDWLSFFDVDEFLEIKPKGIKIKELLINERYNYCQNIKFNWLLYSDDDKLYYENKPVQERFKTPLYNNNLNKHIKSTVRGKLPTNYWKGAINPHTGINNFNCCSSSGKQISKNSSVNIPFDYEYGELKHYRTKTIEEYIKKLKRGRPDIKQNYQYMISLFYYTNKKTKEKSDIFKKEFNLH